MKRIFFLITILIAASGVFGQTATNFNCNDCAGVNHDLFTELDSGNVVILCWVMPCASCIPATLTTYNVVQSFGLTYPGRVHMYIVDDYANTNCTSLTSWCNQNGVANSVKFSNASIKMTDYGTVGMPKVVVVGNYTHHVYYNANNNVNATALSNAITTAIQDFSVGITDPAGNGIEGIRCLPNPASDLISLSFSATKTNTLFLTIYNYLGTQAVPTQKYELNQGEHTITLNISEFENGIYFARFRTESGLAIAKFVVSH